MSALRDKIINEIIEIEGGYVNDPDDSGGETRYGITESTARAYGYHGSMRDLPRKLAFQIYENRYWNRLNLDSIEKRSVSIAGELADTGVNMGVGRAGEFFQRSLNALNRQGELYPDLRVDGDVGRRTIAAFNAFMDIRGKQGEIVLFRALNCLQGEYYISLAERRQKDESFVFGWFLNRVS